MFNRNNNMTDRDQIYQPKTESGNYTLGRTVVSNLMAGSAVSALFFPLESAKKILQQGKEFNLSYKEIFRELRVTGKVQGYVPYRGLPVFALNIVPTTFIQLTVEKALEEYIPNNSSNAMLALRALTSGAIGAVTATIVENTITRQQVMENKFIPTLKDMWNISPTRMFKTYPLIAMRDAIFTLNLFFLHPKVEKYLQENHSNSALSTSYISAIPLAVFGAAFSHPFDTLATNIQKTHEQGNYLKVLKELVNNDVGFRSLFRGVHVRIPLFYGFIVVIPEARKKCSNFIDRSFGVCVEERPLVTQKNLLSNQSFFPNIFDDSAPEASNKSDKYVSPKL